jgi:hypothetical protein
MGIYPPPPPPPKSWLKFQIKDKLEFINNYSSLFKGYFHIKKFHSIYFLRLLKIMLNFKA